MKSIYLLAHLPRDVGANLLWNLLGDSVTNLSMYRSALLNLDVLADVGGHNPALALRNLNLNEVAFGLWNQGTLFLDNLLWNFTLQSSWNVFTLLSCDITTNLLMNLFLKDIEI